MSGTTMNSVRTSDLPVWIFSRTADLSVFLGSALFSVVLLFVGWSCGLMQQDVPEWTWITGVLLVDVAHVYATIFRVYLLPSEFTRRPWLFVLTPLLAVVLGWAIASESEAVFWRLLAYLAVFHFIRQQVGWVAWYRRLADEPRSTALLDYSAIYFATVYPLVYWHAHLPRHFWWFIADDFISLPLILDRLLFPIYVLVFVAYFVRSFRRYWQRRFRGVGKDIVVVTTAVCWYLGIVQWNSDYAFTVTNVMIHGIPYLLLTFRYSRSVGEPTWLQGSIVRSAVLFLATVWMLSYSEELLWDRGFWHDHADLFGSAIDFGSSRSLWLAVLAMPQITHYILDGFIWRRRQMADSFFKQRVPQSLKGAIT